MEVPLYVVGFAVAAVLVGGGVLDLPGRRTPVGPRRTLRGSRVSRVSREGRSAKGAWSNILFGAGLALGIAARIPSGHRLLWDGVLLGPAFVCVVVAFLLYPGPGIGPGPGSDATSDADARSWRVAPPDQVALIAALVVFGVLSAWLLPDGWRLASLPLALMCATVVRRCVAGWAARRSGGEGGGGGVVP